MIGFKQIKRIYEKLEDEESKEIYMKRLQYSLSGNKGYIYEMVRSEMERYRNDDIMTYSVMHVSCVEMRIKWI